MPQVGLVEALRQQRLDRSPKQLPGAVAEEAMGVCVDVDHVAGRVDDHDAVRDGFQQVSEPCLNPLGITPDAQLRDVLLGGENQGLSGPRIADSPAGDACIEARAVLAPAQRLEGDGSVAQRRLEQLPLLGHQVRRHQQLEQRLADDFDGRVAKHDFGAVVPVQDLAGSRYDQDRIRRGMLG